MCELVESIGNTGIIYCTIPLCDQGEDCKKCAVYKKDALIALAEEIIILQRRVKELEGEKPILLEKERFNLKEIAEYFRKKYPKAVKVTFTVGFHNHNLATEETHKDTGLFTTRNLGGEWIEEEK